MTINIDQADFGRDMFRRAPVKNINDAENFVNKSVNV